MRRKKQLIIALLVVAIVLLAVITVFSIAEKKERNTDKFVKTTLGLSFDEVASQYGYFYLWMPMDENPGLKCDAKSICFGDDQIWFFLPSGIDTKNMAVYAVDGNTDALLSREVLDLEADNMIGIYHIGKKIACLPTMYISLDNHEEYVEAIETLNKEIECRGNMTMLVDKDLAKKNGWFTEYYSIESDSAIDESMLIKGRGNSTWNFGYKKSFNLKFEKKINLLGMGDRKKWNLVANAYDSTSLKNIVFNDVSKAVGINYQPEMEPINLYIDGDYKGVYLLTTKVAVSKAGIPLKDGDYLYCMSEPNADYTYEFDAPSWNSEDMSFVGIDYPENLSEEKRIEAEEIFDTFISGVEDYSNDNFISCVDLEELVKYYWIQEASMNFDGQEHSLYMYYTKKDGKIHFGPVWDMDLTLGDYLDKAGVDFTIPEGWKMRKLSFYRSLFCHEGFRETAKDMYLNGGIREALYSGVDDFYNRKQQMGYDAKLNSIIYGSYNQGQTLNYGGNGYDENCEAMIEFYRNRLKWIDEHIDE